jgi:putrescine importer
MISEAASPAVPPPAEARSPGLRRVLNLRHLLVYGMTVMQVVAPIPIFGLLDERSDGHGVSTVLLAMVPMAMTAVSYGRLAALYPTAGSSYSYVGRGLHPQLGFLVGWAILLDYVMIPLISAVIPALAIQRLMPEAPLALLTLLILLAMTGLNLGGIRATLRANSGLLVISCLAVLAFGLLAVRYLHAGPGIWRPARVYDPASFHAGAIWAGVSFAALSYIGFDGLTTLSEDAIEPRRDMPRATVLVVLITGVLSALELYLLHAVLPDWRTTDPNTSYLDVMQLVGGSALFVVFLVIMSLSQFAAGLSVQVSAARLLYGMGRDGALPTAFFGRLDRRGNPSRNIILVGVVAFVGSVAISFDHALDLLNFGAFLAYMGVNLAALWVFCLRRPEHIARKPLWDAIVPGLGLIGSLVFWLGLPSLAKIIGGLWLVAGVSYGASRTRRVRDRGVSHELAESRAACASGASPNSRAAPPTTGEDP